MKTTGMQQKTNNNNRVHSTDTRTSKLLSPDENDLKEQQIQQQKDAEHIKEIAKKRRKEKLKVILMQVDSSKPPKTKQELELERELKRAEDQKKKDEKERERKQKQKEEEEILHV